ncbi:short-chain dehydrogenase/reductase SDR [Fimbriimonas ginsengisoli Gsoil 348]|uniref:Short-chain dehydrogenase/reductase SDR n=1 Tax=Fimbriimonas ginsengisoli Gsoil 348 TaxID=661478 RepID=A0A068NKD8_FIMGI|nr:short-chain dehydrogenase/reductase SDR [Fimbriimonas ginsengisoli Gsoil 348]
MAIVTGGARGIGADICRALSRNGCSVVVNYAHAAEKAEAVAAEARANGVKGIAIGADVRNQSEVDSMIERTLRELGQIDGLINNAISGRQHGAFAELEDKDFQDMFDFGARAVVNTIRAVRPAMKEAGSGRIVNIVTELWDMAPGDWSSYLAGKGAMVGISRALANELGPEGITVNMVAPGWMATETVDTTSEGSLNFGKSLPLRRHGSAEEIGNACAFFLSDLAGYVTGAYLPVTGGRITQMG